MLSELRKLWYRKLKDDGFNDIESLSGALKTQDRRTISFTNREVILAFHLDLVTYLNEARLSEIERKVLESYSDGKYLNEIADECSITRQWVSKIINKHKTILGYKTK